MGRRWVAGLAAAVVVATGLVAGSVPAPAQAVPAAVDDDVSVPGRGVSVEAVQASAAEDDTAVTSAVDAAPVWPGSGVATVKVPAAAGRALASQARAVSAVENVSVLAGGAAAEALRPAARKWSKAGPGDLSAVSSPTGKVDGLARGNVSQVRVVGRSREIASELGATQVFTLERADGGTASSSVDVRVDYSGYAEAFGANYADRLRLVRLPACAFVTPSRPECSSTPQPVQAVNNPDAQTLTARLAVSRDLTVQRQLMTRLGEPQPSPETAFAVMSSGQGT